MGAEVGAELLRFGTSKRNKSDNKWHAPFEAFLPQRSFSAG